MTTKADFSEDEWATRVRSPMVAGMAITLADPGVPAANGACRCGISR